MIALVATNLPDFERWIDGVARRQIPFATALALTRVARVAREDVVLGLPLHFVVRGPKLAQSIRWKPASKTDWPRPQSVVYTLAEALVLQESGGIKVPRKRALAIPGAGTRPTVETRITASKRPAAVLRKRGYFLGTIKGGVNAGAPAILQRVGAGRYPLRVAYLLRPRGEVKARLGFVDTVRLRVESTLPREFLRAMDEAFAGSRR